MIKHLHMLKSYLYMTDSGETFTTSIKGAF